MDCLKDKGFLSQRQKLLSGKHSEFDEISPLTIKDLQVAHKAKTKLADKPGSKQASAAAPSSTSTLAKKRQLAESQDENTKRQKMNADVPKYLTMTKINEKSPSQILAKSAALTLTAEQTRVLEAVKKGKSLFFTGSAGTGKSFLLKRIIASLPPNHTFPTASTGVAACHIGGTTLHAFAGIGSGKTIIHI